MADIITLFTGLYVSSTISFFSYFNFLKPQSPSHPSALTWPRLAVSDTVSPWQFCLSPCLKKIPRVHHCKQSPKGRSQHHVTNFKVSPVHLITAEANIIN